MRSFVAWWPGEIAIMIATILLMPVLFAQPITQSPSVATFLDKNGRLNVPQSFTGTLDPSGYRMLTGGGGAPLFLPSATALPGDEKWDDRFGYPGANGAGVYAITVASNGDVYFGGQMSQIGSLDNAGRIARYTPSTRQWSNLGTGFDTGSLVYAIAVNGDNVYVGGFFRKAGGVPAHGIALWNISTSTWSALGSGIAGGDTIVTSLAVNGGYLYVGGNFTSAGSSPVSNLARLSLANSSWSDVDGGVSGGVKPTVYALVPYGPGVLVGGRFTTAGTTSSSNVAIWDGNSWIAAGRGVNNTVAALAVGSAGTFYAGGYFNSGTNQDGSIVNSAGVIAYNGSWTSLAGGVTAGSRVITALTYVNGTLYAGGLFTAAGNAPPVPASNIATYNGQWNAMGAGTDANASGVLALASDSRLVYVGGDFFAAGPLRPKGACAWNQSASVWESLGWGLNGTVNAILVDANDVYVGGSFTDAGGNTAAKNIARWDRTLQSWFPLSTGITGTVYSLVRFADLIWVGGTFSAAGAVNVAHLATWDPVLSIWADPGANISSGLIPRVKAMAVFDGELYIGGTFSAIGGLVTSGIARYHPFLKWAGVGGGVTGDADVRAMAVGSDGLYIGGRFRLDLPQPPPAINPFTAENVARWDGINWSTLSNTGDVRAFITNGVNTILAYGGAIFVGGGGDGVSNGVDYQNAHRIALWNGTAWEEISGGMGTATPGANEVKTLDIIDGRLYAGGSFVIAGSDTVNGIASSDGSAWSGLGSGTFQNAAPTGTVNALGNGDSLVFVGGSFVKAGGKFSLNFGEWGIPRPPTGAGWALIPSGLSGRFRSLDFTLDPTGYVAGGFGLAAKTSNRGIGWTQLPTNTGVDFNKIRAVGVTDLFVAGNSGTLLKSTDAGTSFSPVSLGTTANLMGFDMAPDNLHGSLVGTNSFIAVTTDGGNAWRTVTPPINATYNSAAVLDASLFFVVGQKGIILKSTDGGTTWNQVPSGTTRNLTTIFFWDATNGIIGGDNGMVLRTTNGGSSFNIMRSGTLTSLHGGGYLDMNTVALCGDGGLVLLSTDAGLNYFVDQNAHYGTLWDMSIARNVLHKTTDVVTAAYAVEDNGAVLAKTIAANGVASSSPDVPRSFSLSQNYPNPFNPGTAVRYQLSAASDVRLVVFDLLGREVAVLVNETKPPGSYEVKFDGARLSSGVYFYRLDVGQFVATRKMALTK